MNIHWKRIASGLLVLGSISIALTMAQAQERSPTRKETLEFLLENYPQGQSQITVDGSSDLRLDFMEMPDGSISVSVAQSYHGSRRQYFASLKSFKEIRFLNSPYGPFLALACDKPGCVEQLVKVPLPYGGFEDRKSSSDTLIIIYTRREDAESAEKAFGHLILLEGGGPKKKLF